MWSPKRPDFAPLADAIYDREGASPSWLAAVFRAASKSLLPVAAVMGVGRIKRPSAYAPDDFGGAPFEGWGSDQALLRRSVDFIGRQSPSYFRARRRNPAASDHALFGDAIESFPNARWMRRQGFADAFVINSVASDGTFTTGSFMLPERSDGLPRGLVAEWELVAHHLTIGAQLRHRTRSPDAILRLDGTIVDAHDRATAERDLLRDLVRRLMRSRGVHRDRANALSSRRGGRWTFLDHFESDGRHVILAHAETGATKRLSTRERRVAELIAQGRSHKEIAARLDLSVGTVASYTHRIFKKLGVQSRVELPRALDR